MAGDQPPKKLTLISFTINLYLVFPIIIHMTDLQLISLLIGILGLHWVLRRYAAKPILELGATLMFTFTTVMLLWMGAWQFDGVGVKLVLVMSAIAAFRHGWRFYKAKAKLAS